MQVDHRVVGVLTLGERLATVFHRDDLGLLMGPGIVVRAPQHLEAERDGRGADGARTATTMREWVDRRRAAAGRPRRARSASATDTTTPAA